MSIRANAAHIQEAYDDRLFDGADEHALSAARSRLTVARDRLAEELRFLSDLAPARAREVLGALADVNDGSAALAVARDLPNLARLNALADLLSRSTSRTMISAAWDAQRAFDPVAAREAIDQARAASGFRPVSDDAWKSELQRFQDEQADILHHAIVGTANGAAVLTDTIEETRDADTSDWLRKTLDKVVDRFDRWSEPELVRIEEALDESIESVRNRPDNETGLTAIEGHLKAWDEINQPVQLREQAKGLDEPKSRRVFDKVRDLTLWLANEEGRYASAQRLSIALQETFPELPKAAAQLVDDLDTLGELVHHKRTQELLSPLLSVIEEAKGHLRKFSAEVAVAQFSATGNGIAGRLYREFKTACASCERLSKPDLPWVLTRSVALSLSNDADDFDGARRILEALISTAPQGLRVQIGEDLETLKKLLLQKQFKDACEDKNLELASSLAHKLMDVDPENRSQYATIKQTLEGRISERTRSRWFWGILGTIVAFAFLTDQCSTSKTGQYEPSPSSYETQSVDEALDAAADNALVAAEPEPATNDTGQEIAPPPYHMGDLDRGQLRYCKFEKRRIELLEPRTPRAAYSQFNARVDDFNSRCGQGRYSDTDGAAIDAELITRESELMGEADRILSGWLPRLEDWAGNAPPSSTASELPADDPLAPEPDDQITTEGE